LASYTEEPTSFVLVGGRRSAFVRSRRQIATIVHACLAANSSPSDLSPVARAPALSARDLTTSPPCTRHQLHHPSDLLPFPVIFIFFLSFYTPIVFTGIKTMDNCG
jgi:hypothetical protein